MLKLNYWAILSGCFRPFIATVRHCSGECPT